MATTRENKIEITESRNKTDKESERESVQNKSLSREQEEETNVIKVYNQ